MHSISCMQQKSSVCFFRVRREKDLSHQLHMCSVQFFHLLHRYLSLISCDTHNLSWEEWAAVLSAALISWLWRSMLGPSRIMLTRVSKDFGITFCWHSSVNDPLNEYKLENFFSYNPCCSHQMHSIGIAVIIMITAFLDSTANVILKNQKHNILTLHCCFEIWQHRKQPEL